LSKWLNPRMTVLRRRSYDIQFLFGKQFQLKLWCVFTIPKKPKKKIHSVSEWKGDQWFVTISKKGGIFATNFISDHIISHSTHQAGSVTSWNDSWHMIWPSVKGKYSPYACVMNRSKINQKISWCLGINSTTHHWNNIPHDRNWRNQPLFWIINDNKNSRSSWS
jgi:hypothetical protein